MKHIILIFICGLLFLNTVLAEEKERAGLAPMGTLGEFSAGEKKILYISLQEFLSKHDALASQKAFEAALTQAFEDLEYDECTEDQCFALIQQILQVDNLFLFNMTREESFTQLSLTRVDLDSQRLVHTVYCDECGIGKINAKIEGLVGKIIVKKKDTEAERQLAETRLQLAEQRRKLETERKNLAIAKKAALRQNQEIIAPFKRLTQAPTGTVIDPKPA